MFRPSLEPTLTHNPTIAAVRVMWGVCMTSLCDVWAVFLLLYGCACVRTCVRAPYDCVRV